MTNRKIEYWVIPPECDAEFVANMEDVLDTYEKPYNPAHPVLCMDEQPVQLIKEVRPPIAGTKNILVVSITNTNGPARRQFSCSQSLSPVGVRRPLANRKRKSIGLRRWRG